MPRPVGEQVRSAAAPAVAVGPLPPVWKEPIRSGRVALALCLAGVTNLVLDAWLRVWVLMRLRHDEARRIAALNKLVQTWGTAVFGLAEAFLGLRLSVEGTKPEAGRYLIVANHQSSLDIPMLIRLFRPLHIKFVAMDRLRHGTLVISPVLRNGGFVFVGKKKVGEDLAALNQFARDLHRFDGSPLIFPDGRLTRDGSLGNFYLAGLEAIRRNSGLPVLPVVIDGLWKAPTIGSCRRIVGNRVRVRILAPIPWEEIDRDPRAAYETLEISFRQSLDELRRLSDEAPAP